MKKIIALIMVIMAMITLASCKEDQRNNRKQEDDVIFNEITIKENVVKEIVIQEIVIK